MGYLSLDKGFLPQLCHFRAAPQEALYYLSEPVPSLKTESVMPGVQGFCKDSGMGTELWAEIPPRCHPYGTPDPGKATLERGPQPHLQPPDPLPL